MKYTIKPTLATAEKNSLPLELAYLEPICLHVGNKKRNANKDTLNCCKLKLIF